MQDLEEHKKKLMEIVKQVAEGKITTAQARLEIDRLLEKQ